MRFSQTTTGRVKLDILDDLDFHVADAVCKSIAKAFSGKLGIPYGDSDEAFRSLLLAGGHLSFETHHEFGFSLSSNTKACDGIVYDIANYLLAHATQLGIEPKIEGMAKL